MVDTLYQNTAHLLRRAGFGASPDDIRFATRDGLAATTDKLLNPEHINDPIDDNAIITRLAALVPEKNNGRMPAQVVKWWWAHRMIQSQRPLIEKMTLFWHGHFTSSLPGDGDDMLRQNQLLRANALGNFRTLALAVSRDPAMLRYLNGNQNFKAHPNENYGRELMELFTCGIGNYTEDDVKAAARSFSGWNLRAGEFFFNTRQHDNSEKTFLGKTGNWNGDDIVDMLVAHPATAKRLCTQLYTYFIDPDPAPAAIDALVKTYYRSGYDIKAIVGQILQSNAFYSDKARFSIIKTPAQYVIGTIKMLGLAKALNIQPSDINTDNDMANMEGTPQAKNPGQRFRGLKLAGLVLLPAAMRSMGQDILAPPSVKGWDGGEAWINSYTLANRINFGEKVSQGHQLFNGQFMRATNFIADNGIDSSGAWIDYLANTLGPLPLPPATRQTLIDYVNGTTGNDETRYRGAIALMLATPEYQVC